MSFGIPWGISEAAFNLKDLNSNYQYKAFGVPWLGLKRGLGDEMVVSSYGTILAVTYYPREVFDNLKVLEGLGMYGKYGFFESIDFTPERLEAGKRSSVVETYMAHHQALILLSINNLINNNVLQKRFMENPEIKATDILLQERMPSDMLITKERKEKTKRIKYSGYDNYVQYVYSGISDFPRRANVLSSENYLIQMDDKGEGFSSYKGILINRYKETSPRPCGIFVYIRDTDTGEVWRANYDYGASEKYEVLFAEDVSQITKVKNGLESVVKTIVASSLGSEIRSIKLKNNLDKDMNLEITGFFQPVLSKLLDDVAHPAFNNLFLKYSLSKSGDIIVKREKRGESGTKMCLGANLFYEGASRQLEYETDFSKVFELINSGENFSNTIRTCY